MTHLLGRGPSATSISPSLSLEHVDEGICVKRASDRLQKLAHCHPEALAVSEGWIRKLRQHPPGLGSVEGLTRTYPLNSPQGLALMRLAESVLRTPDASTRGMLMGDLLAQVDWRTVESQQGPSKWLAPLLEKAGKIESHVAHGQASLLDQLADPLVQSSVILAIEKLGAQFLYAQTQQDGLKAASKQQQLCSFDMLGEGARTQADADVYFEAYKHAALVLQGHGGSVEPAAQVTRHHGLSIKLSAMCPRFEDRQRSHILDELVERVNELADLCLPYGTALTLDAEENDRLILTLEVLEAVAMRQNHRKGLGLAVQAYNKRSLPVIEHLIDWAKAVYSGLQIRLVKGAYWDHEIALAQREGYESYPVFTSKAATDLNYLACARTLLAARPWVYPMFATHNPQSAAFVLVYAQHCGTRNLDDFEFQRLHGMGEQLWECMAQHPVASQVNRRVYAPLGRFDSALAYLVRRLLENGSNSSFVHAVHKPELSIDTLNADPLLHFKQQWSAPDAGLPSPAELFPKRRNSMGYNLNNREVQLWFEAQLDKYQRSQPPQKVQQPPWDSQSLQEAYARCHAAHKAWARQDVEARAAVLERWAESLQTHRGEILATLVQEAGKTWQDALAEWREAQDFLFHYASEGRRLLGHPFALPGPAGELNQLQHRPRGVCVCISPWNFPLAILMGQVSACLMGGNGVLVKAAPQTRRITELALGLAVDSGLPPDVVIDLGPHTDTVKAALSELPVHAVFFTGSVGTARSIQAQLAAKPGPIVPLIAETGGVNCMIVDSTALLEQACDAIIQSAFGSAGQRCSSLRVVYVQKEISHTLKNMVFGAMQLLHMAPRPELSTDVGPLIDAQAHARMHEALTSLQAQALHPAHSPALNTARGMQANPSVETTAQVFTPHLIEMPFPGDLSTEWFGPLLQWVEFQATQWDALCEHIESSAWGLTLGLQSRIPSRAASVAALGIGNVYINRGMTGAVVGSQPFGGMGLSGTGPKAGGYELLLRTVHEQVVSNNLASVGGIPDLYNRLGGSH